jgi:purine-binding chemotaxis protein CheW
MAAKKNATAAVAGPVSVEQVAAAQAAAGETPVLFQAGQNAHLVIFKSANGYFGIDIKIVQEIILMQEITRIPSSAPYIAGMTDLRGRVIPVAAFTDLVGMAPTEVGDKTRIVVVENNGGFLGLVVDAVTEVMMVDGANIDDASACGAREHDFIVAIAKLPEYLVSIVDVPALIALADRRGAPEQIALAAAA